MGIDIYDVMQGVGAGLVTEGNRRETKRKEELMQKLKLEDEAREKQREIDREDRAAKRKAKEVDPRLTKVLPNASGALEEVLFNSNREEIGRGPLSVIDEEKIAFDRANRERDAKDDDLRIRTREAELDYLPVERDLRRRSVESTISANNASAERQRRDPADNKPTEQPSREAVASALVKEFKDLQTEYDMTPSEFREAASEAARAAGDNAKKGLKGQALDIRFIFRRTLEKMHGK